MLFQKVGWGRGLTELAEVRTRQCYIRPPGRTGLRCLLKLTRQNSLRVFCLPHKIPATFPVPLVSFTPLCENPSCPIRVHLSAYGGFVLIRVNSWTQVSCPLPPSQIQPSAFPSPAQASRKRNKCLRLSSTCKIPDFISSRVCTNVPCIRSS